MKLVENKEQSVLRFYGEPGDAHSIVVDGAWRLAEQHAIHIRESRQGTDGVAAISSLRCVFTPRPMEEAGDWFLEDGLRIRETIGAFEVSDIKCIFVPEHLVELFFEGDLRSLVVLARWYDVSRHAGPRPTLFPNWPTVEWIREKTTAAARGFSLQSVAPLTAGRLQELADQIRVWAPHASRDEDGPAVQYRQQEMASAVQWLEGSARRLRGEQTLFDHAMLGSMKFGAAVLLSSFRASRLLRASSKLTDVLRHGMDARWPGLFDLDADRGREMSKSTVQRTGLLVDTALLLMEREGGAAHNEYYRFAWSDGTDLGGRQMLMSRHRRIHRDQIVEAMEAAHKMAWDRRYKERALREERRQQEREELGLHVEGNHLDDMEEDADEPDGDLAWPVADGPEPAQLSDTERARLCAFLYDTVVPHVNIPVGLALGLTDVSSKMAASVYAYMWECSTLRSLKWMLSSFCTYTTDMGAELGLAKFVGRVEDMLPEWHGHCFIFA